MLDWLLIFASVNLAMCVAVALPAVTHQPRAVRRLALASAPALWALLMFGAYAYLWATTPPSPIATGPDGHMIILRHGNLDWLLWESRVSAVSVLALWLTVATLLGLIVWWLARSRYTRQRRIG